MDNTASQHGYQSFLLSILLGTFSWFTPQNTDLALKVITAMAAVVAAIFAARYHIMARRLKKKQLEQLLDNERDNEILE